MNQIHPPSGQSQSRFPCSICKKNFSSIGNLKRHSKLHDHDHDMENYDRLMNIAQKSASRNRNESGKFVRANPPDITQTRFQCFKCLEYFDEESLKTHQEETGHSGSTRFKMPENMRM